MLITLLGSEPHRYNVTDLILLTLGKRVRYCRIETDEGELVAIVRGNKPCDRWFKKNDPTYDHHTHKMFPSFGQALANVAKGSDQ